MKVIKLLTSLFFFIVLFSFFLNKVHATCNNQIQCERVICCDWQPNCSPGQEACTENDPVECTGDNQLACENEGIQCTGGWQHVGGECEWGGGGGGGGCPFGQIFCGGCIGACRANTQTCNEWIEDECTPPLPPPGQDTCYECSGSSCEPYTVPEGTCSTNCGSGCGSPPPDNPSCSVSLSPGSYFLAMAGPTLSATANVSNVQNGTVSSVGFSIANTSVATTSPASDTSSPYESTITQVSGGTTTLTANVYMGDGTVRCSATATVTVIPDEAPNCETFDVSDNSVFQGNIVQLSALITDEAANLLTDGGFDSGGVSNWPANHQLNDWWAVPIATYPLPGAEGTHYAKISRQNPAPNPFDPFSGSALIDAGENVMGQTYTLKFLGRSHEYSATNPNGHVRIAGLLLQTDTIVNSWAPWPEFVNNEWNEYSYDLTFPTGATTNKFRVILRPPENYPNPWNSTSGYNFWPVYYDSVRVYKTNDAGVNDGTVNFYSIPTPINPADYCVSGNWTLIGTGTPDPGNPGFYEIDWDTTGLTADDYTIAVNAADDLGNFMSGNPGNCATPGITYRPLCYGELEVTACTPDCSAGMCGQADGCGSFCANTDAGVPNNPTLNSPAAGNYNMTATGNQITTSWALPVGDTRTDFFNLVVYEQGTFGGNHTNAFTAGTSNPDVLYADTYNRTQTQQIISNMQNESQTGRNLTVAVRGLNSTCSSQYSGWTSSNFSLTANITGTFYEYAGACSGTTATTVDLASGTSTGAVSNLHQPTSTNTNGTIAGTTYSFTDLPYNPTLSWGGNTVSLDITNSDPANNWLCACFPGGSESCQRANILSPNTNTHFYLTNLDLPNGPWWQTKEGNVYGAAGYSSNIPDSANSYLIIQNADSDIKSAGIPLSGGVVGAGTGWYTEYNSGGFPPITQPRANNTSHTNIVREDYDYFVRNIDLSTLTSLDPTITVLPEAATGTLYEDARIFKRTGDLTLNLNALQTVTSGTKMIIFVSENVTINNTGAADRHLIDIQEGGYLAIIADGNITINNTVGNTCTYPTCSTTGANIDGVYVASNQLIIEDDGDSGSPDNMFVGEGTFVGWQGIDLRRTYDNTGNMMDATLNNTYATEIFNFRPDFNANTPEILLHPNLVWQEVN